MGYLLEGVRGGLIEMRRGGGGIGILCIYISETPTSRTRAYFRCHVMAVRPSVRRESHLHKFMSIQGVVFVHNTQNYHQSTEPMLNNSDIILFVD